MLKTVIDYVVAHRADAAIAAFFAAQLLSLLIIP
jgi:hypothetical protein